MLVQFHHLPQEQLQPLLAESRKEGFRMLDRLVDEYGNGQQCFDRPGEAFFGVYHHTQLVGVGGLTRDPYYQDVRFGRVRHLYVLPAYRCLGFGRQIVETVITIAEQHFQLLLLRTTTFSGAAFYQALGFDALTTLQHATHVRRLSVDCPLPVD
jgi:GNAT superfamily N-acetyltransferase